MYAKQNNKSLKYIAIQICTELPALLLSPFI